MVSPSESAADVEETDANLIAGCLAVVMVYPRLKKVGIVRPGERSVSLHEGDMLALPDLLPGWAVSVSRVFQD